jgi:spindle assembly abnormal protein 6
LVWLPFARALITSPPTSATTTTNQHTHTTCPPAAPQSDLRLAKEKAKRKQAIILRQEEELAGREQALAAAQREQSAARQESEALQVGGPRAACPCCPRPACSSRAADLLFRCCCSATPSRSPPLQPASCALRPLQAELAALRGDNERLKARLEESQQQLQSNEQMIRWLNQQVTEAQLGATTALPSSSRYTFRPSSTLATPAAGLLPAAGGASSVYPSRWAGTGCRHSLAATCAGPTCSCSCTLRRPLSCRCRCCPRRRFTTPGLGAASSTLKTSAYHTSSYTPLTTKTNMVPTTGGSAAAAAAGLAARHLSPSKQARSYSTTSSM